MRRVPRDAHFTQVRALLGEHVSLLEQKLRGAVLDLSLIHI